MNTNPDRDTLRQHIAEAIRAAACPGDCGKAEEECAKERIQPFVWHHGRLAVVEGEPEMFADAVLAVLPEPTDRAVILTEAADEAERVAESLRAHHEFERSTGALDVMAELRRLAAEAPTTTKPETEAHPPTHTWKVESPRRDKWASWGATHAERVWATASYEDTIAVAPQRAFRLVRATTTYVVEAEHQPAAGVGQDGAQPQEPPVVAYRSDSGRLLNCLRHVPPPAARHSDFHPVTAEDLPDGGICTYPECGVDVLIPQDGASS